MTLEDEMVRLEDRLKAVGATVQSMCAEAGIARSTWDRWKRGETEPNFRSWRSVEVAVTSIADRAPQTETDAA